MHPLYRLKNLLKPSYTIITILVLFSCNEDQRKQSSRNASDSSRIQTENSRQEQKANVAANKTYNDLAMLLAGMSQGDSGTFSELEKNASWKNYAALADTNWHKLNVSRKAKMRRWADKELAEQNNAGGTIFYPFSGPDFLNVYTFFPEADTIVMVALEPPGSMPEPNKIPKDSLSKYFRTISRSMNSVMKFSFFRTNSMAVDLKGKESDEIDGALPVVLIFLARTGNSIADYGKVVMDTTGKVHEVDMYGKSRVKGFRVLYKPEGKEELKTLYYFSVNLQDGELQKTPYVLEYLKSQKINTTYLKAASYLMHKSYFSKIRNLILNRTNWLLQDDSGIPLGSFVPDGWDLTFYGSYDKPIPLFDERVQEDLKAAFRDSTKVVKPLPFGIGYDWIEKTSNLMLAKKKPYSGNYEAFPVKKKEKAAKKVAQPPEEKKVPEKSNKMEGE